MKSQPEQSYDFIGLVLKEGTETGTVIVQQRNHFKTGETVEVLTPRGDVFPLQIGALRNGEGEIVEAAPHPLEELVMETDADLPAYTILRRPGRGQ